MIPASQRLSTVLTSINESPNYIHKPAQGASRFGLFIFPRDSRRTERALFCPHVKACPVRHTGLEQSLQAGSHANRRSPFSRPDSSGRCVVSGRVPKRHQSHPRASAGWCRKSLNAGSVSDEALKFSSSTESRRARVPIKAVNLCPRLVFGLGSARRWLFCATPHSRSHQNVIESPSEKPLARVASRLLNLSANDRRNDRRKITANQSAPLFGQPETTQSDSLYCVGVKAPLCPHHTLRFPSRCARSQAAKGIGGGK